jgi:hypothetical protein
MRSRIPVACFAALLSALGLAGCASHDSAWVHENLNHTEHFHAGTSVLETPPFPGTRPHHATLRATARTRGSRIGKAKLRGRRDSVVISVPAEYIEGLLARMENRAPIDPRERMPADSASVPAALAP